MKYRPKYWNDLMSARIGENNGRDYWGSQEMDNCEIEIYSEKEEN